MTAEDHHHQTDHTKKITREQEGKEDRFGLSHIYEALCIMCMCIHALFKTQR